MARRARDRNNGVVFAGQNPAERNLPGAVSPMKELEGFRVAIPATSGFEEPTWSSPAGLLTPWVPRSGTSSVHGPIGRADSRHLSWPVAPGFRRPGQGTAPRELLHGSRRYSQCRRQLENEEVVRDRNWVSSRQPDDIPVFNKTMIQLFAEAARSRNAAGSEGTSPQRKGATSGR